MGVIDQSKRSSQNTKRKIKSEKKTQFSLSSFFIHPSLSFSLSLSLTESLFEWSMVADPETQIDCAVEISDWLEKKRTKKREKFVSLNLQCGLREDPKEAKIWAIDLNALNLRAIVIIAGGGFGLVGLDLMVRAWVAVALSWGGFGVDRDLKKNQKEGLHRRRCSFTSRLAWEA
jgi:hypothetical protein